MIIPKELERQGITETTFKKLLAWGWIDSAGRSLEWKFWNPDHQNKNRPSRQFGSRRDR